MITTKRNNTKTQNQAGIPSLVLAFAIIFGINITNAQQLTGPANHRPSSANKASYYPKPPACKVKTRLPWTRSPQSQMVAAPQCLELFSQAPLAEQETPARADKLKALRLWIKSQPLFWLNEIPDLVFKQLNKKKLDLQKARIQKYDSVYVLRESDSPYAAYVAELVVELWDQREAHLAMMKTLNDYKGQGAIRHLVAEFFKDHSDINFISATLVSDNLWAYRKAQLYGEQDMEQALKATPIYAVLAPMGFTEVGVLKEYHDDDGRMTGIFLVLKKPN